MLKSSDGISVSGATAGDVQEHDYATFARPYNNYAVEALQPPMQWSYGQPVPQQPYGYGFSGLHGDLVPGYQNHSLSYREPPTYPLPEVIGYEPPRASPGSKLSVYIRSTHELLVLAPTHFFILFQEKRCDATLIKMANLGHYLHYEVATNVPILDNAGWLETVPLQLHMEDETGQVTGFLRLGHFTYEKVPVSHVSSTTEHQSRKRKISPGSSSSGLYPSKRRSTHNLREMAKGQSSSSVHAQPIDFTLPSAIYSRDAAASASTTSNTYKFPAHTTIPYSSATKARIASHHSYQPYTDPVDRAFLRNVAPFNPHTSISRVGSKSPIVSTVAGAKSASEFINRPPKNPTFVRTLTLPSTSLPKSGSLPTFNPYSIPNRPVLDIAGDLKDMLENWTDDEQRAKRRLVQFEISQSDNTIKTCFKPVTLKERLPDSVCISCIWWEEKQEAYVTSVDTIHLLESLVAVRFTTEEKNRIRRNLQAFKPLVVSKGNAETSGFFKVIMGFEKPRPRNIEKDTKVFPWKALMQGLKKIIGKYVSSKIWPCILCYSLTV